MGLDITAYGKLTPAPDAELDDQGYPMDGETIWRASGVSETNNQWPGRAEGLSDRATYKIGESFGFRAGSYGGYNNFRAALAQLAGMPQPKLIWDSPTPVHGPFVELINFSDCEGVIGPVVATKLASDFAEHEAAILAKAPDAYFRQRYRDWRKAFEMASDNGAVEFH